MDIEDEPCYISSNTVSGSSSPIAYGSEDEEEVCNLVMDRFGSVRFFQNFPEP
jgi:hypothetical protein